MTTQFFILDEKQNPIRVSEAEHIPWVIANGAKYYLGWHRQDGTKSITLSFEGIQKPDSEKILFMVHAIFRDRNGFVITDTKDNFNDYEDAREHYDFNLYQSGA